MKTTAEPELACGKKKINSVKTIKQGYSKPSHKLHEISIVGEDEKKMTLSKDVGSIESRKEKVPASASEVYVRESEDAKDCNKEGKQRVPGSLSCGSELQEAKRRAKQLQLKVLEGGEIPPGTTLQIDASGLAGSRRNARDGSVYFGTEEKVTQD